MEGISATQSRQVFTSKNNINKAHKEYLAHIYANRATQDYERIKQVLKEDLRHGRQWAELPSPKNVMRPFMQGQSADPPFTNAAECLVHHGKLRDKDDSGAIAEGLRQCI